MNPNGNGGAPGEARHWSERTIFDPHLLEDPLALKTEWTELSRFGANFRTYQIQEDDWGRVVIGPSGNIWAAFLAIEALAMGMFLASAMVLWLSDNGYLAVVLSFFLGLPVSLAGWFFWSRIPPKFCMDLGKGLWWEGSKPPSEDPTQGASRRQGRLSDVHAVQILCFPWRKGSRHSMEPSMEVNLVFHDGSRFTLFHSSVKSVHDDGERLAKLLRLPCWSQKTFVRRFDPARDPPPERTSRRR